MINFQGIVKPVFRAYRFMKALGDELLGGIVTRNSKTKKLSAIAYHYPLEMTHTIGVV